MADSDFHLDAVQRWMQAVIMHPDGVAAGLDSETARQHLDVPPEEVESVVSRSQALSSVERLSIYANAYYARLLECLGEEFPVLKQTLGEETFDAFAFGYLQMYPSRSYTLGKLGENFARFLAETRPVEDTSDEIAAELSADDGAPRLGGSLALPKDEAQLEAPANCRQSGLISSSIWRRWNGHSRRYSTAAASRASR